MINYQELLNKNMIRVLRDILQNIRDNGLSNGNHLYITFLTDHKNVKIPFWLKEKFRKEMTIVIQYEYYDLEIKKNSFHVQLSFNNIKSKLEIGFNSILSFADPSANFGLILQKNNFNYKIKNSINLNKDDNLKKKDNVIDFSNFKKN